MILVLLLAPVGAAGRTEVRVEDLQLQVELTPQGKGVVEASALLLGETKPLELELRISRSGSVELEGRVELPEEVENLLSSLNPTFLNVILSSYEGKTLGELVEGATWLPQLPKGVENAAMENVVLEEIEVKELKVLHPGVRFSLLLVLGGVEEGRDYLPLSLRLSLEPSGEAGLLSAHAEFSLPREGGRVVVRLPEGLGELLEGGSLENFSLALKLPEGAEVSGLPQGFENQNGTYRFSGDNMELFQSLVSDLGGASISYECSSRSPSFLPGLAVVILLAALLLVAFYRTRGRKKG